MSAVQGKVFVLEASDGGHVFAVNPDGSGKRVLVSGLRIPDGITVDADRGHVYWTNMGNPAANDGSIERVNLDGTGRVTIVPLGATHTPKQLQLDAAGALLLYAHGVVRFAEYFAFFHLAEEMRVEKCIERNAPVRLRRERRMRGAADVGDRSRAEQPDRFEEHGGLLRRDGKAVRAQQRRKGHERLCRTRKHAHAAASAMI